MKYIIKLEELSLFILICFIYFLYFNGTWSFFLLLFFVPDVSFALYLLSKKIATIAYNIMHHKGIMVSLVFSGLFSKSHILTEVGLIFLAHSFFDRVAGYGLKYSDSFDHTHLGWIGKSKHLN